jgi:ethanolaminephosphotransferase
MPVIEKKLLKNLKKYKYSGVDKSLLSKYVLQPYWTRLVEFFPLWSLFSEP